MQPGLSLDDIIARKRAQVKAKKSGKIVAPIEDEKEVNEDDESGMWLHWIESSIGPMTAFSRICADSAYFLYIRIPRGS